MGSILQGTGNRERCRDVPWRVWEFGYQSNQRVTKTVTPEMIMLYGVKVKA